MAEETATLAAYVANLKFDDIPSEVRERAKVLTLDFLGSAIRARRDAESTPSLLKMLEALALDGSGESTVFGDAKTWTPAVAALLNGALGHSLDFDDTHADSSLHPSAPVVPAAFAVGELVGAPGRDVLTAIVAGYEVCCRLGNALDPTSHYARGFHPTATAGTYGAAAAAAKLFGLSQAQIIAAFGVSGSQAAGSLQFLVNGAWNKRYQVGAAAMNGVIAATLARNDFVGASESVEGKHGLLVGYTDNAHPDKAVAGLGKTYETMKIGVKPYPSCRYTHAALDARLPSSADNSRCSLPAPSRSTRAVSAGMITSGSATSRSARWPINSRSCRTIVLRSAAAIHLARASALPPTTACMSGSMPIRPASRPRFPMRRRWRRNS
jgi:2-methylcitrate dehydratase PrpD